MKKFILYLCFALGVVSCGTENSSEDVIPNPSAAMLRFPENNSTCIEGEVLSEEKSNVTFRWNNSDETDMYTVNLTNLENNEFMQFETEYTEIAIQLSRATPYSWQIVSSSLESDVTALSEEWKFYNAGERIVSYAPFPPTAHTPENGSVINFGPGVVSLEWECSDVNEDLASYDLYFGTDEQPQLVASGLTALVSQVFEVQQKTQYFWYVVAKDSTGNTALSDVFSFYVNE